MYTNMAANFFVVLIPRDWVKTLYSIFLNAPFFTPCILVSTGVGSIYE